MTAHGIRWRFIATTVARPLLPLWFAGYAVLMLYNYGTHGFLFLDIAVYREAALSAIAGGDPWAAQVGGLAFAAPPPTLLLFLPVTFLPLELATLVVTVALAAAAIWSIRRLRLPWWWLLFPPLFECLIVGNPDVLVLAFLLMRGPLAGVAVVAKVYGVIPLIYQRRWGALLVGCALSALTLPLWPAFFDSLADINSSLDSQSEGFSAWGTWWLVPTALALWVLRRKGAEWLVVPGLWPHTQIHYGAMSLPVMRRYPLAAAIMGLGTPLAPPIAIILIALQERLGLGPPPEEPLP
ncbi:MAG: glycosyltransferase 87 family protein [Candidatus Limnocylindrales bacterium]